MHCAGALSNSSTIQWQWSRVGAFSSQEQISFPQLFNSSICFKIRSRSQLLSRVVDNDETILVPSSLRSITSSSNPFLKHCVKLRQSSSYRRSHGSTLVIGSIPIREIYEYHILHHKNPLKIDCLFLLEGADIPEWLQGVSLQIISVNSLVMRKLSGLKSTESTECIALLKIPSSFKDLNNLPDDIECNNLFPSHNRILVLDQIQDPGNLGTLLRSSMAFGWDGVFLLGGCCDPFNEKVLRASRGASFHLPLVSGNWGHLNTMQKTFQLKMLAGHPPTSDKTNQSADLSQALVDSLADKALCLVLGSEGSGLSQVSKEVCQLVSIPMESHLESLNVAVAGGIFLFMLRPIV